MAFLAAPLPSLTLQNAPNLQTAAGGPLKGMPVDIKQTRHTMGIKGQSTPVGKAGEAHPSWAVESIALAECICPLLIGTALPLAVRRVRQGAF